MASYGRALRTHLEGLLLGTAGVRTMAVGRFHKPSPDRSADDTEVAERAIEVVLSPGTPLVPVNSLDDFAFYRHRFVVRVRYLFTRAGGDLAEGLTESDGSGTLEDVRDRATTDAADIARVLIYHENRDPLSASPLEILVIAQDGEPDEPTPAAGSTVAILEVPFLVDVQASLTSAFAP